MRLNHLDLAVPDVPDARDFFITFFDFVELRTLGVGGLAILKGADGLLLVLSRRQRSGSQTYPEEFHIGFHLDRREDVMAIHERLASAGCFDLPAPNLQRGAFGFYFHGPGEILIEVAVPA